MPSANTIKNRVLRQTFALELASDRYQNAVLVNYDECHYSAAQHHMYSYQHKGKSNSRVLKTINKSFTLMMAACSDGTVFHCFLEGSNNSWTFSHFLIELSRELDRKKPGWRTNHVFLLDNARVHTSKATTRVINFLQIPTCFTAPNSYPVLPIERIFGMLKSHKYNLPQLLNVVNLTFPRVKPKNTYYEALIYGLVMAVKNMPKETVQNSFKTSLAHLGEFIGLQPV